MEKDINKPVENPKLTALFKDLADADDAHKADVREMIAEEMALNAELLAVIHMDDDSGHKEGGTFKLKKDTVIQFEMLSAGDMVYLPVYTDWNELLKCEKYQELYKRYELKTLILSFDDIAAISAGEKGVAVNPYSDNFIIGPQNVKHMKTHKDMVTKGCSEQTVTKDTRVLIGEPTDYPVEMVESITRYARKNRSVKAIWLKLMERDGEQSYLAIVDFNGDRNAVFGGIAEAARPYLRNMYIDMVPYSDRFGQSAAKGEPFYRRKGLF